VPISGRFWVPAGDYVKVRNVPVLHHKKYGDLVTGTVLNQVERFVAREIIRRKLPVRGREVTYFRGVLGLSRRNFAKLLQLSHIAILKWEKAKHKRLELVNEIAVKTLLAGLLRMKLSASFDALVSKGAAPKKLILDLRKDTTRKSKRTA
jgi:DNA-binding transcriptional regulator YiaG